MDIQNGVIKDPRPVEQVEVDYKHVSGSVPIVWKELGELKLTSKRWQDGSSSCVFQAGATALEKLLGKVCSATPYFWRANYPDKGSWLQDMGNIFYNRFTTLESLSPSQNQSEAQMNQMKQLTTFLGITGYRQVKACNIDLVAEAIESYGQCVVAYGSNNLEWVQSDNTPKYLGGIEEWGHAICALQYGLVNGKKVIVCRDSAVPSGITIITEEFHTKRSNGGLYFMGGKDVQAPQDLEEQKKAILQKIIELYKQIIAMLFKK